MAVQSQTSVPPPLSPLPTSDTVKTTLAAFPDATPVTAWMLVRGALTFHNEYGNYLAKRLVTEAGPPGGKVQPASSWLEEVNALFDPAQVTELHGRLFILGLAELDPDLARFLDSFGFRDALKREIQEPYDSLLRSNSQQATANVPPSPFPPIDHIPTSDTVKIAIQKAPEDAPVSAWFLIQEILRNHNEYGGHTGKSLVAESGPTVGTVKLAWVWLQEVWELFDPNKVQELHGRLFILGLSELDQHLDFYLERYAFQELLKQELQEPYESLLRPHTDPNVAQSVNAPAQTQTVSGTHAPPPTSSDYIIFRADAATDIDQLGRAGFADALATWLNRIWGENYTAYVSQLQTAYELETPLPQTSSFIVHLHGPWGSGKTTLLRLMEKALRNIRLTIGGKPHTWTVVWFNAWRNRQIEPVWWPLMDRVYRELVKSPSTDFSFWAWETGWRLWVNGLGENPLMIGMGIVAVFGLFFWLTGSASSDSSWLAPLQSIGGMIGLAGTLGAGILTLSRSLFSASSAQNFTRLGQDPMEKVRTHFRKMMDRTNHPIMVFIDDLDRCQPEYVVRLLESLQTLFNDPRVFYVIAADRRWLYECFEIVYKDFKTTVREPGRRTGYLFLEKIFQMSISVPAMSEDTQKAYLDTLYRGEKHEAQQKIAVAAQQAQADFAEVTTTEALIEQLQAPQPDPDPLIQQARREAAVRRLASQEVSADIEHFLQPFAPLLERNPRAMKRLVNAYSVYLALAMLADVELINNETKKKRFALWTILSLRWPALAEKLENDPENLPAVLEKKPDGLDPDLAQLTQDEEVQRVLHGEAKGVNVALDTETILRLWGLQANTSTPVVA